MEKDYLNALEGDEESEDGLVLAAGEGAGSGNMDMMLDN
jgi:hypothetical protein